MSDNKNGLSILYLAIFLLALNGLFSKVIPLDSVSITQIRSVIAAIALFVFAVIRKRAIKLDGHNQYLGVFIIGMILGLHWISFYHSMQVSTVAIGMISLFTYPVITVVLEPFFNKKHIRVSDVVAGIFVIIGIFIMVMDDFNQFDNSSVQGVLWGVLSAVLFSIRNLLQKYYYSSVSSDSLIMYQVLAISFMLIIFIDYSSVSELDLQGWGLLILLGVVSTATAHSLLSYSLKHLEAKSVAMISCLQPLFATFFAWLLLDEKPTVSIVMGGLIIISVALYESIKKVSNYRVKT